DLRPDVKRGDARKPAVATRNPWSTSLLPRAAGVADLGLLDLDREMSKRVPARDAIVKQARQVAAALNHAAERIASRPAAQPGELMDRLASLSRGEAKRAGGNWEEATQLYHALLAHANAWRDMDARSAQEDAIRRALREVAKELSPPPGRAMPAEF